MDSLDNSQARSKPEVIQELNNLRAKLREKVHREVERRKKETENQLSKIRPRLSQGEADTANVWGGISVQK